MEYGALILLKMDLETTLTRLDEALGKLPYVCLCVVDDGEGTALLSNLGEYDALELLSTFVDERRTLN
jgi:hypothetical protein